MLVLKAIYCDCEVSYCVICVYLCIVMSNILSYHMSVRSEFHVVMSSV